MSNLSRKDGVGAGFCSAQAGDTPDPLKVTNKETQLKHKEKTAHNLAGWRIKIKC